MRDQAAKASGGETGGVRAAAPTHASSVHERLRADILSGRLPIRTLMERYGIGQTPLREALNRLAAAGLLRAEDQRGFAIPGISACTAPRFPDTRLHHAARLKVVSRRAARASLGLRVPFVPISHRAL